MTRLSFVLLAFMCISSEAAVAGLITLTATQDAGLRGDFEAIRNSAEGLDDKLLTEQNDPSYALVQFDLSGVTESIQSATLRMQWHTSNVLNQGVGVYRFEKAWSQNTVTWNNINGGNDPFNLVTTAVLDNVNSIILGPDPAFAEWDVTAAAQEWNTGSDNHGLILRSAASDNDLIFFATEHATAAPPQLLIETASSTAVPEPSAFVLMGAGLCGIGAARYRRRRHRKTAMC